MQSTMLIDLSPFTHFHRFSFTFASLTRLLCGHYLGGLAPGVGVVVSGSGSGSRWVGPGSARQTDAQTVDLTLSG